MLSCFWVLAAFVAASHAAITELNCTDADGKYASTATNCDNVQNDVFCTQNFGPDVTVGDDTDRPNACWKDANAANYQVKLGAIASCPKTCGWCCISAAFACSNAQYPRITCSVVTQKQCNDPKWREILAEDCPNVCGLCNSGGCLDLAVECENDKTICRNIDMQDFVKVNCQKTCGYCASNSTSSSSSTASTLSGSSSTSIGSCTDGNAMCASWSANGFCASSFYPTATKKQYCGRTCGLC